jgi:hypothetical protein
MENVKINGTAVTGHQVMSHQRFRSLASAAKRLNSELSVELNGPALGLNASKDSAHTTYPVPTQTDFFNPESP